VLHLLDRPVPLGLDGAVASALLTSAALTGRPVRYEPDPIAWPTGPALATSSADEQLALDRLRNLGYLA
jgi:hypothetical protein